jgi:hypothetical protein
MNIKLERKPTPHDHEKVFLTAEKPCECSEDMKVGMIHGDEKMCKPCAARQVINGLTSLADTL